MARQFLVVFLIASLSCQRSLSLKPLKDYLVGKHYGKSASPSVRIDANADRYHDIVLRQQLSPTRYSTLFYDCADIMSRIEVRFLDITDFPDDSTAYFTRFVPDSTIVDQNIDWTSDFTARNPLACADAAAADETIKMWTYRTGFFGDQCRHSTDTYTNVLLPGSEICTNFGADAVFVDVS